uniref:Phytocyanin domain-containing protein n=1 Tax=Oryza punctata TaxID=4537 RepID=A0A0E0JVV7_ORYPU
MVKKGTSGYSHGLGLACFALVVAMAGATQFKVGGDKGWSVPAANAESYNDWAEKMRFQIGDTLVFVYPKDKDSVLVVEPADYNSCNTSSYDSKFADGNTVVTLDRAGAFFFISGVDANCRANEKLIVMPQWHRHRHRAVAVAGCLIAASSVVERAGAVDADCTCQPAAVVYVTSPCLTAVVVSARFTSVSKLVGRRCSDDAATGVVVSPCFDASDACTIRFVPAGAALGKRPDDEPERHVAAARRERRRARGGGIRARRLGRRRHHWLRHARTDLKSDHAISAK